MQQYVQPGIAVKIHLAVVGENDKVHILIAAGILHSLQHLTQPDVHLIQRLVDLRGKGAVVVAGGVDIAVVQHQHIGLFIAQQRAGAAHDKVIHRIFQVRAVALAALALAETGQILPHRLQCCLIGTLAAEGLLDILIGQVEEVFVDHMVDVGVASGDRPIDGGRGAAGALGGGKEVLHPHMARLQRPVDVGVLEGLDLGVDVDAVLAGTAAGDDGSVGRIGHAGIDSAYLVHLGALFHDAGKVGLGHHISHVLTNHRIHGQDEKFLFHGKFLLF